MKGPAYLTMIFRRQGLIVDDEFTEVIQALNATMTYGGLYVSAGIDASGYSSYSQTISSHESVFLDQRTECSWGFSDSFRVTNIN